MELGEAVRVVRSLADGIDPFSGEVFPAHTPWQNPQIVRALYMAAEVLQRAEQNQKRRKELPERTGEKWTEPEDKMLSEAFDAGEEIASLAQKYKRTTGSIWARLEKLGKVRRYYRRLEGK